MSARLDSGVEFGSEETRGFDGDGSAHFGLESEFSICQYGLTLLNWFAEFAVDVDCFTVDAEAVYGA